MLHPDCIPIPFGHWFAGFTDGEGCFDIHPVGDAYICRFVIGLRADDLPVLERCRSTLGLGDIRISSSTGGQRPQARWSVTRKAETAALVTVFERFPLQAKKQRDFLTWAEAVRFWMTVTARRAHDWTPMTSLHLQLRAGRAYEPFSGLEPAPRRPVSQQLSFDPYACGEIRSA